MLNRLTISWRMYLILAMTLLMIVVNAQFAWMNINKVKDLGLAKTKSAIVAAERTKLKVATDAVAEAIGHHLTKLSAPQAKEQMIRTMIEKHRYEADKSGYFFAYHGTTAVSIGPKPQLEGKDLGGAKDANGVYFVRQMAQAAENGGGFVTYIWPKPGAGEVAKLSYATMIPGSHYWLGTGVYLDNIDHEFETINAQLTSFLKLRSWYMIFTVGAIWVIITILSLYIIWGIVRELRKMIDGFQDIAEGEGDLTKRLEINGRDEINELAGWFNTFLGKLQNIIVQLSENARAVDSSSTELLDIAGELSNSSRLTSERSRNVAHSSEEMSSNLGTVAATMEESSGNANMVAAAGEEMSVTIHEIAENSEKARGISDQAVQQAETASLRIAELGEAAQKIGKVTETITEISEQTNLLALNATIEAARAGEAGKGFAVVANEIKELARQTAEATRDIQQNIDGVQATTGSTVTTIDEISTVINQVNEIVAGIAAAVEEQSVTTREIADSISRTSSGLQEINEHVSQSSIFASDISREIKEVNEAADQLSSNSQQVQQRSEGLSSHAHQLAEIVATFKV